MIYTAISEEQVQLVDALIETLGASFNNHSSSLEKCKRDNIINKAKNKEKI